MNRVRQFIAKHKRDIGIALVLFVIAAVPRMTDLGTFLTADEKNWMGRSFEFIRAGKDWRFNDTLQTTHPGVTTLWLSGAAITAKMLIDHIPFSFQNLMHFVKAAQMPIALVNSLAIPVMYLFLKALFSYKQETGNRKLEISSWMPLLAALLIALNPFLIGYSRVAHVDALMASFLFLAALATMIYAREGFDRRWLIASAVLSALAILTKAPAVFMVPFFWLVVLVKARPATTSPATTPGESPSVPLAGELARRFLATWRDRTRDFVLWLLVVGLIFVILWPAMLFVPDPQGNALLLKRDLLSAGLTPHHMAEDYTLNSSHYLFTLLTRTTPVTFVFASLAIIGLLLSKFPIPNSPRGGGIALRRGQFPIKSQFPNDHKRTLFLFLGYIVFFVVMMMLVAKKGDRYILPVFPALDLLAAFGLLVIGSLIGHWSLGIGHFKLLSKHILSGAVVLYLAITAWTYHPYSIAYSNPLFPDNLGQELGWGEGLEQVGAWLSEHDPQAIVASWYPEELGAYTSAHVAHINAHEQGKVRYVVLYRNMFGRAPDHYANNFIDEYYNKREPVFVAQVAGKEFAWVYEKWSFEQVVGELLPAVSVGQTLEVTREGLTGLDVLVATYTGTAVAGELVIEATQPNGTRLQSWRVPVRELGDDQWLTVRFSQPLSLTGKTVNVRIFAAGTSEKNAPTVRYTNARDYRSGDWQLSGTEKPGDLALRLRYQIEDGQEATEEETRLLP